MRELIPSFCSLIHSLFDTDLFLQGSGSTVCCDVGGDCCQNGTTFTVGQDVLCTMSWNRFVSKTLNKKDQLLQRVLRN